MEMKTGDILATWHPFEFNKVGLGMAGIRKLTNGPDHVAIVIVDENCKISVMEASYSLNEVIICSFATWMYMHRGARVELLRSKRPVNETMFRELAYVQIGKNYDVQALLWHHLYYQLIKKIKHDFKWQGPTENGKAANKFYCSELAAYLHDFDVWWNNTPADIYKSSYFHNTRIEFYA